MGETYRELIEAMYRDVCDVYRHGPQLQANKETRLVRQRIYKAIPCFLSQKSLASNRQTEPHNRIQYEVKLFLSPDVSIQQGDELHVARNGLTLTYTAGEPFRYTSHQEISLERKEYA